MATVDVGRLQAELRALHSRLEMLEVAAIVAAEERDKETEGDAGGGMGPSPLKEADFTKGDNSANAEKKSVSARNNDQGDRAELTQQEWELQPEETSERYTTVPCNLLTTSLTLT